MNIADHVIGAAESPALIVADDGIIPYGELYANSQRVAALLHEAGLRPGDGVALVLPNRPEFFEITWGCQLSGLYYSAVNTHFTPDEVVYVVNDCKAKAVFIDESMAELAEHILRANPGVDVHISVGAALPGWRPYRDALSSAGEAPLICRQVRDATHREPRDAPRPFAGRCRPMAADRGRRRCSSIRWCQRYEPARDIAASYHD